MANYIGLAGWILLSFTAGIIGSQFEPGTWYQQLQKPGWTPPAIVFPVVWPILYVMMGISAWWVWSDHGFGGARLALGLFILQLVFNAAWSWLFFGKHWMGVALIEIVVLWLLILGTIIAFGQFSKVAAYLLVPYLLWVTFATALNAKVYYLN